MTPSRAEPVPLEQYFQGRDPLARRLFDAVRPHIEALGEVEMRVTKSQVAFWRKHPFAWMWIPTQYLKHDDLAPLVLTMDLHRRDDSSRWKQVVEPRPGVFVHHLELFSADQLDTEVDAWLREAWGLAG